MMSKTKYLLMALIVISISLIVATKGSINIDYADSVVVRIFDKLYTSGQADNTIIVLWAEHGYLLGDKESCVKFNPLEKAKHSPFMVVAPGVAKFGTKCYKPVSLIDIYPTLIELAGCQKAKTLME
jgi:arylsulfatase A-like enzyme